MDVIATIDVSLLTELTIILKQLGLITVMKRCSIQALAKFYLNHSQYKKITFFHFYIFIYLFCLFLKNKTFVWHSTT